jgi:hypothetical protein
VPFSVDGSSKLGTGFPTCNCLIAVMYKAPLVDTEFYAATP